MTDVHPTAIVHTTARLAPTVEVGPYCVIGPDVTIAARTVLKNHVTVDRLTRIGRDNVIHPYAVIGASPQDLKFHGERVECVIGDHNEIREHVTIHRGTRNGGGITRIGSHNLLMVGAHIAHDCIVGDYVCLANQVMLAGHVQVESRVNVGGGAGIHHYATLGTCAFIGGLSRVNKDVPPFMIVDGNPAEVRGVNLVALARLGFDPEHVAVLKEAYRSLYRENGAAFADKLDELGRRHQAVPAIRTLCAALAASSAGVHGRALENRRSDDKRESRESAGRGLSPRTSPAAARALPIEVEIPPAGLA